MTMSELKFMGHEKAGLYTRNKCQERKEIGDGQDSVEHMLILESWNFE